jgi:hypothetical protein
MKKCKFLSLVLIVSLFGIAGTSSTFADGTNGNENESWYWQFALHGGTVRYQPSSLEQSVDSLRNNKDIKHISAGLDLSFLWPLANQQTAMGITLNGTSDSLNYTATGTGSSITISSSLLGFSVQHFLMSNIGDGFFVRGDIGLGSTTLTLKNILGVDKSDTEQGLGVGVGLGYSIPLSSQTRLPLFIKYNLVTAKDNFQSRALTFNAGLMF